MTAIVGVLNSQGIAIAADSAVTVTGSNVKKVYNRSNKIFTLSKYHPVGIAIFNNADFMGIPLETIIKLYRNKLKESAFPTVDDYKVDFLKYIKTQIKNVSADYKRDSFYGFCNNTYHGVIQSVKEKLSTGRPQYEKLKDKALTKFIENAIDEAIQTQRQLIDNVAKAAYLTVKFEDYAKYYDNELNDIISYVQTEIQKEFNFVVFNKGHTNAIKELLFQLINVEYIFEKHCGLVFIGFGEEEIYPSSHLVFLGTIICDELRARDTDPVKIQPGTLNSNIIPYAQGDVTTAVLTGVDPNYKNEVMNSIQVSFKTIAEEVAAEIKDAKKAKQFEEIVRKTSVELIKKLDDYQFDSITGPLLEILAHMGKEDMAELAESLVNITSLKRKFTSSNTSDESVGGPVDVAIITKGDGFIWMKRKNYFDIELNRGFFDKYYK